VLFGAAAGVAARAEVGHSLWSRVYRHFPGARYVMEFFYRLVADHRNAAFRVTRLFWGRG
jgi:hypothetical protein